MIAEEKPAETLIYYSKVKSALMIVIGIVAFSLGLYLSFLERKQPSGFLECVLGGVLLSIGLFWLLNNKPQLIISNAGIQSSKFPLISWKDISNESVDRRRTGRITSYYLYFSTPDGFHEVRINLYNIKPDDLEELLKFYRNRFEYRSKQLI